jgi:hypothetical protein
VDRSEREGRPRPGKETDELEARVLQAARLLHRAKFDLVVALAAYDRSGRWAFSGASTCAGWAADVLGVAVATAREWLRVGHALERLPVVAAAFRSGQLSYAKVRTLTRVAIDHPDRQSELVDLVTPVVVGDLGAVLARWCDQNEDPDIRRRRQRRETFLAVRIDPDGMATMTVRLPALEMGRIQAAIEARVLRGVTEPKDREMPPLRRQRARALVSLLTDGSGARVDAEVIVHVRADGCTLHDGTPVANHEVADLIGTAFIRALIHDIEGRPIDATYRRRRPDTRQARVVDERVPRCVDCGSTDLLQYDHDPPFAVSGRTVVDELTRRCPPCHRRRHRS